MRETDEKDTRERREAIMAVLLAARLVTGASFREAKASALKIRSLADAIMEAAR